MGKEHQDLVGAEACGTAVDDDSRAMNGVNFMRNLKVDDQFSPLGNRALGDKFDATFSQPHFMRHKF